MIHGIGVDIVEIDRMRGALTRQPGLRERLFTSGERAYCDRYADPAPYYAVRFAAKEAVAKAAGRHLRWQEVEMQRDGAGRPTVLVTGESAEWVGVRLGAEFLLSLSHSRDYAVATAVLQFRPRRPEDPSEQRAWV